MPKVIKKKKNETDKDDKNKEFIDKIKGIFINNKERYGYRRITLELRNQGYIGVAIIVSPLILERLILLDSSIKNPPIILCTQIFHILTPVSLLVQIINIDFPFLY